MNESANWISSPNVAYERWQTRDAAGADRRHFSARSIVQHRAMFERFSRYLRARDTSVITFDEAHLDGFFDDVTNRCAPGSTTRLRYGKLVDRLCRHLVDLGLRETNPAERYRHDSWPEDEPVPVFLDRHEDEELKKYLRPQRSDGRLETRNRAIVALLLAAGITAAEIRGARVRHLLATGARPHFHVEAAKVIADRKVPLPAFSRPILRSWQTLNAQAEPDSLLFTSQRGNGPLNDTLLGAVVRNALLAVDITLPDMSPRVLRNTYARRLLLTGDSNDKVTALLGLGSTRTAVRLRMTLPAFPGRIAEGTRR